MLKRALCWVADRELLFVAALGPLFVFPIRYTPLALLLVVGLWLVRWAARGRLVPRQPLVNGCLLVLLAMLPLSLWASVDLSLSWPRLYQIVYGVALFYALSGTVRGERQARWFVTGLLAVVVALCLVGVVGTDWARAKLFALPLYRTLPAVITDQSRFPGGSFHPNVVAGTLAPFVPFAVALLLVRREGRRLFQQIVPRLGLFLLVLLLLGVILLTQSRGGWLALVAGLLVLLFLLDRRAGWGAFGLAAVAAAVAFVCWGGRLGEVFLRLDTTGSGTSRLEVWSRALAMLRDMPFTGIGLGTFPVILDAFYPSFLAGPEARIPHAHNLLLQVGVDLGVAGMLAFALLFVASALAALRALRRAERRSFAWGLSAGTFAALVVVAVHGLFDAPLWTARSSPLLWLLLAGGWTLQQVFPDRDDQGVSAPGESWERLAAFVSGRGAPCPDDATDGERLVALAENLKLSALLYRVLQDAGCALPAPLQARLANAYRATLGRSVRCRRALTDIARAFADAGVPLVVLKGLVLAETVYPDPGCRVMSDLDLLVRPEDVDRAHDLLSGLGYSPDAEADPAGHGESFVRQFEGERLYLHPDHPHCPVELHWFLVNREWFRVTTRLEGEALWERVRPLPLDGITAWQFSAEDTMLYLCFHLAVHHRYGLVRAFVDLDRLVRHGPTLDWAAVVSRARDARLRNVVYFALRSSVALLDTPVPAETLQQLAPSATLRWLVGRRIQPERVVRGETAFGPQSERLLHFLLVDRESDRWMGLLRVAFPGRQWIAARYAAGRPGRLALYIALHPLRMLWLARRALGQWIRRSS